MDRALYIYIFLYSCVFGVCCGSCQQSWFNCGANESIVDVGFEVLCPEDTVCNEHNVEPCGNLCVPRDKRCHFQCDQDSIVVNDKLYKCPEYYTCNSEQTRSCEVCLRKKCVGSPVFSCHEDDDTRVTIQNMDNFCNPGFVCNKDYLQPCYPCTERTDSQPPSQLSTTTTETITSTLTSTTPANFDDKPNCNDGLSYTKPCRPGKSGASYYYKCTITWTLQYKLNVMTCANLYNDRNCRNVAGICA